MWPFDLFKRRSKPSHSPPRENHPSRERHLTTQWLLAKAEQQSGVRLGDDHVAMQRLSAAAETALSALKHTPEHVIDLPFIAVADDGPKHLSIRLSQQQLSEILRDERPLD